MPRHVSRVKAKNAYNSGRARAAIRSNQETLLLVTNIDNHAPPIDVESAIQGETNLDGRTNTSGIIMIAPAVPNHMETPVDNDIIQPVAPNVNGEAEAENIPIGQLWKCLTCEGSGHNSTTCTTRCPRCGFHRHHPQDCPYCEINWAKLVLC